MLFKDCYFNKFLQTNVNFVLASRMGKQRSFALKTDTHLAHTLFFVVLQKKLVKYLRA